MKKRPVIVLGGILIAVSGAAAFVTVSFARRKPLP